MLLYIVYSLAASICEPSQLKTTIGLMELAWCKYFYFLKFILGIGIAVGPLCASIFYFIGGYMLPYVVCGVIILVCVPLLNNLNISEVEEGEVPSFLIALWNPVKIILNLCHQL